jgi:hypothetical protein
MNRPGSLPPLFYTGLRSNEYLCIRLHIVILNGAKRREESLGFEPLGVTKTPF